jgi:phospholipase/carboxylesterase
MPNSLLSCVEINPPVTPIASVIWLHGLGADGHDFVPVVAQLQLPATLPIRFVFPHAPLRAITMNNGYTMRAWYDLLGLDAGTREDAIGVQQSAQQVTDLIRHEQQRGVPLQRIVLAGFSQGGAMALHCGLRFPERLAGILALSTYLPLAQTLPDEMSPANHDIPIFMAHGAQDPLLPLFWAQSSREVLQKLNYALDFRIYPMMHSVCMEEINDISAWLQNLLKI